MLLKSNENMILKRKLSSLEAGDITFQKEQITNTKTKTRKVVGAKPLPISFACAPLAPEQTSSQSSKPKSLQTESEPQYIGYLSTLNYDGSECLAPLAKPAEPVAIPRADRVIAQVFRKESRLSIRNLINAEDVEAGAKRPSQAEMSNDMSRVPQLHAPSDFQSRGVNQDGIGCGMISTAHQQKTATLPLPTNTENYIGVPPTDSSILLSSNCNSSNGQTSVRSHKPKLYYSRSISSPTRHQQPSSHALQQDQQEHESFAHVHVPFCDGLLYHKKFPHYDQMIYQQQAEYEQLHYHLPQCQYSTASAYHLQRRSDSPSHKCYECHGSNSVGPYPHSDTAGYSYSDAYNSSYSDNHYNSQQTYNQQTFNMEQAPHHAPFQSPVHFQTTPSISWTSSLIPKAQQLKKQQESQSRKRLFSCPLNGCRSFTRRYNMLKHFRDHAYSLGATRPKIEKAIAALRAGTEDGVPYIATTEGLGIIDPVDNRGAGVVKDNIEG
jgi:DNA-directed RNA polymerase subunit M/transcription elongation factor TFIIS